MMGRRHIETGKILRAQNDVRGPRPCRKPFARFARVMMYVERFVACWEGGRIVDALRRADNR